MLAHMGATLAISMGLLSKSRPPPAKKFLNCCMVSQYAVFVLADPERVVSFCFNRSMMEESIVKWGSVSAVSVMLVFL
jgi:hypothetical protein